MMMDEMTSKTVMSATRKRRVVIVDDHTLWLRRSSGDGSAAILAVVRLSGGAARVPVETGWRDVVLTTEDPAFVDEARAIAFNRETSTVEFQRPGTIVFARQRIARVTDAHAGTT